MKWLTLTLSLLLASNMTFAMGGKGKNHKHAEHLKSELNLTDEQVEKVAEIRKNKWQDHKENQEKLKAAKTSFKSAINDPKTSNEELTSKYENLQRIKNENGRKKFEMMLQIRSILNPEQLKKFRAMKDGLKADRSNGKKHKK